MGDRQHLWPQTIGDLVDRIEWQIRAQREKSAPDEAVGIAWWDGTITALVNHADDPEEEYFVELRDISVAVARKGLFPVGVWHTHWCEKAIPSGADIHQLESLAKTSTRPLMLIYGTDGLRAWTWDDGLEEVIDG